MKKRNLYMNGGCVVVLNHSFDDDDIVHLAETVGA